MIGVFSIAKSKKHGLNLKLKNMQHLKSPSRQVFELINRLYFKFLNTELFY